MSVGDRLSTTVNGSEELLVDSIVSTQLPGIEPADFLQFFTLFEIFFDTDDVGGTLFTVSFERDEGMSAPNSFVELPEVLDFVLPLPDTVFNVSEDLLVTWQPSGISNTISLAFDTVCPTVGDSIIVPMDPIIIEDSGFFSIPITTFFSDLSNIDPVSSCRLNIELYRTNLGTLDPSYADGGSIRAIQRRVLKVDVIFSQKDV